MTSLPKTLDDRGQQYGEFEEMSKVAQDLKLAMKCGTNWDALMPYHKEALEMIATKLSRILVGNPYNPDSWHDIGGYAKLAEDRCPRIAAIP